MNVKYEVKLYFTIFLNYFFSLSLSVPGKRQPCMKEGEREPLYQSKSLATKVLWPR